MVAEETQPIEVASEHRCVLGELTDRLASDAAMGDRGAVLADEACVGLRDLFDYARFETCCLPAYLALAPARFDREIQLPIAAAEVARLDTRVLLWPVGAKDGDHPHREGWAAFVVARGSLVVDETVDGQDKAERALHLRAPEVIYPGRDVTHHIHNRGGEIGVTVHLFGT